MQNKIFRKGLVVGIILLFFGLGIFTPSAIKIERNAIVLTIPNNTFYVGGDGPENYTKIQDAIDNAIDGDTIYVYSGTYNEWIRLHKQLFIKGIKKPAKDFPIINGGNDHDTVIIYSDGCYFEDFKVRNGDGGFLEKGITLRSDNNIINNCVIYHTGWAIFLESACNNTISNNYCYNGHVGFQIRDSHNNTFFYNTLDGHNNHEVEFDEGSKNNLFFKNNVTNCGAEEGIELVSSDNNLIIENNISYNCWGLVISSSRNITVRDNIFWKNGIVITGPIEKQASHTIENNLLNGKPIYYYANKKSITVPEDAGQIILINCTYFTIKNCKISRADYGILLQSCSYNTISDNEIFSSSPAGIKLLSSNNNILLRNSIRKCGDGIYLGSSNYNTISNNSIEDQNSQGIKISNSENNEIVENNLINNYQGIHISSGSDNQILRNNIFNSDDDGVCLQGTISSSVLNNNIIGCSDDGIMVEYGNNNIIKCNQIKECDKGIGFSNAKSSEISRNVIFLNNIGITISGYSSKINVYRNHIDSNQGIGLSLGSSFNIIIMENNFIGNIPNAKFSNAFPNFYSNRWIRNYWDDKNNKKFYSISGEVVLTIPSFDYYEPPKVYIFPLINYDFRPAQSPYDITFINVEQVCDID